MKSLNPQGEWECDKCGLALAEDASFCPSCASIPSEGDWLGCPTCGGGVISADASCPYCGTEFDNGENEFIDDEDEHAVPYKAKGLSKKIKFENILQSWDVHISGMAQKYDDFFKEMISEFEKKKTGLKAEWVNVGSLFGSKKKMLKISWNRYSCFVGADLFGTDLFCTWNLYDPKATFFGVEQDKSNDNRASGFFKSDFNEINEVKAFASVCLDCVQMAAEKIFDDNNLDKSKIKKKSSGALGPL